MCKCEWLSFCAGGDEEYEDEYWSPAAETSVMDDPVCSEVNDGLRSPAMAAASADAEGVMRGIGEEIAFSLFGLGSGRWALSIVGVPMRVGFEKSFFLDNSFFSLPELRGVGRVYCEAG